MRRLWRSLVNRQFNNLSFGIYFANKSIVFIGLKRILTFSLEVMFDLINYKFYRYSVQSSLFNHLRNTNLNLKYHVMNLDCKRNSTMKNLTNE